MKIVIDYVSTDDGNGGHEGIEISAFNGWGQFLVLRVKEGERYIKYDRIKQIMMYSDESPKIIRPN